MLRVAAFSYFGMEGLANGNLLILVIILVVPNLGVAELRFTFITVVLGAFFIAVVISLVLLGD